MGHESCLGRRGRRSRGWNGNLTEYEKKSRVRVRAVARSRDGEGEAIVGGVCWEERTRSLFSRTSLFLFFHFSFFFPSFWQVTTPSTPPIIRNIEL